MKTKTEPDAPATVTEPFCWAELATGDVAAARAFYHDLFGWRIDAIDTPGGPYQIIETPTGHRGGIMALPEPGFRSGWTPYVLVADLEATLAAVEAGGGSVAMPPATLGDGARIAWLSDPEQGRLGIYQAGPSSEALPATDPDGPPHFCYAELVTADLQAARRFYGGVFSWQLQPVEGHGAGYVELDPGTEPRGGFASKTDPDRPSAWMPYVRVAEVAATLRRAVEAGAREVVPATSIPGGTIAVFADPQGARLGLYQGETTE